jgi:hypothetical protein
LVFAEGEFALAGALVVFVHEALPLLHPHLPGDGEPGVAPDGEDVADTEDALALI